MTKKSHTPGLDACLKQQWFWIAMGCTGYLLSLYAILLGLGFGIAVVGFPLVFLPMALQSFSLEERLKCTAVTAIIAYMVLLVILVNNSYFPTTAEMVLELFFVLLVTIPAFLLRAPMYMIFGIGSVDAILLVSGFLFLMLFVYAVVYLPRLRDETLKMMLSIFLVSIFITFNECIELGKGIYNVTQVSQADTSVRNYYRVAVHDRVGGVQKP